MKILYENLCAEGMLVLSRIFIGNLISRIIRAVNHCNQGRGSRWGHKYRNFQLRAMVRAQRAAGGRLMGPAHISMRL